MGRKKKKVQTAVLTKVPISDDRAGDGEVHLEEGQWAKNNHETNNNSKYEEKVPTTAGYESAFTPLPSSGIQGSESHQYQNQQKKMKKKKKKKRGRASVLRRRLKKMEEAEDAHSAAGTQSRGEEIMDDGTAANARKAAMMETDRKTERAEKDEEEDCSEGCGVTQMLDVRHGGENDIRKRRIVVCLGQKNYVNDTTDCFDDVISGKGMVCRGSVRASWLNDIKWISSREEKTAAEPIGIRLSHEAIGLTGIANVEVTTNGCPPGVIGDATENVDSLNSDRNAELESLQRQLNEIKKRLWPAAVRCFESQKKERHRQYNDHDKDLECKRGRTRRDNTRAGAGACDRKRQGGPPPPKSPREVFERARRTCNPFEELGEGRKRGLNGMFVNRSAMKLANLDALMNFELSRWPTPVTMLALSSHAAPRANETFRRCQRRVPASPHPFKFVDLCGAPGGFSEYIFYRCHRNKFGGVKDGSLVQDIRRLVRDAAQSEATGAMGWGMSLLGKNDDGNGADWRLDHLIGMDGGSNVHFRVSIGADGTGDIYEWDNVQALQDEIREYSERVWGNGLDVSLSSSSSSSTDDQNDDDNCDENMQQKSEIGARSSLSPCIPLPPPLPLDKVHLVMADGGFDAQRNSEEQEHVTYRIIVCQIASALHLLAKGGTFILKTFGSVTTRSRQCMELLYRLFEGMVIVKPVLSRPASAERYVVCRGFRNESTFSPKCWRDKMLMMGAGGRAASDRTVCIHYADRDKEDMLEPLLDQYLYEIDRDILKLNIKACFGILSCLEMESHNFMRGCEREEESDGESGFRGVPCFTKRRHVDVHMYKKAWMIDR